MVAHAQELQTPYTARWQAQHLEHGTPVKAFCVGIPTWFKVKFKRCFMITDSALYMYVYIYICIVNVQFNKGLCNVMFLVCALQLLEIQGRTPDWKHEWLVMPFSHIFKTSDLKLPELNWFISRKSCLVQKRVASSNCSTLAGTHYVSICQARFL